MITLPNRETLESRLAGIAGSLGTNMYEHITPRILAQAGKELEPIGVLMFLVQEIAEYAQDNRLNAAATHQVYILTKMHLIPLLVDDQAVKDEVTNWYSQATGC